MFRRFIRRVGWGATPGGRGFFSHRGPHMPHGGGGGLFRVLSLPLRVAASLLRMAALLKHRKKGVHRGHHARVRKGRKPKIGRAQHPHGIKRPVTAGTRTQGGRSVTTPKGPRRPNLTFTTGVFDVSTGKIKKRRLLG